jgi:penicillin-binding protein 2
MTAQLANGGYKITPRIIDDGTVSLDHVLNKIKKKEFDLRLNEEKKQLQFFNFNEDIVLYRNQENIKFVHDAMYSSTNEVMGTSFRSRHTKKKYLFAGKTGTSQIKRITEERRELEIKNEDLPYEERDHALFIAFAPYKNPRYAMSVVIEHGGTGSSSAAPLAKKIIKLLIDRHSKREERRKDKEMSV